MNRWDMQRTCMYHMYMYMYSVRYMYDMYMHMQAGNGCLLLSNFFNTFVMHSSCGPVFTRTVRSLAWNGQQLDWCVLHTSGLVWSWGCSLTCTCNAMVWCGLTWPYNSLISPQPGTDTDFWMKSKTVIFLAPQYVARGWRYHHCVQ